MSDIWKPTTAGSVAISGIASADIGPHEPPADADISWQESWCLAWFDPHRGCGGWHHIGLQRNRGFADVWNWLVVGDRVAARYDNLRQPLPDEDFPDFDIGGMRIENHNLRDFSFHGTYANDSETALEYTAFTDPFYYDLRPGLIDMGTDHYESHGRVTGWASDAGGVRIPIDGFGWADHSWGNRDWSQSLAHRWLQANFGPESFVSVWQVMTAEGSVLAGYVFADSTFYGVERVSFGAGVSDDGYSPAAANMELWTDTGRGFRIVGSPGVTVPVMHDASFWMTDALTVFESNGRLGAGFFEVRERNQVPREAQWVAETEA
jgi:hypothetical protein